MRRSMTWLTVAWLSLLCAGCSAIYGRSGEYDGTLSCKGKGSLTGNGNVQLGAGYGGGGSNAWTIVGDCGDGFSVTRTRERGEVPVK